MDYLALTIDSISKVQTLIDEQSTRTEFSIQKFRWKIWISLIEKKLLTLNMKKNVKVYFQLFRKTQLSLHLVTFLIIPYYLVLLMFKLEKISTVKPKKQMLSLILSIEIQNMSGRKECILTRTELKSSSLESLIRWLNTLQRRNLSIIQRDADMELKCLAFLPIFIADDITSLWKQSCFQDKSLMKYQQRN